MTSGLERLRVVDFTTTIAGPHCTRLLADLGAQVIKVEPPEGDMMRDRPPLRQGASATFGQLNAGKQSVVIGRPGWKLRKS
jgi:CoA:oxalate CoA-transferase